MAPTDAYKALITACDTYYKAKEDIEKLQQNLEKLKQTKEKANHRYHNALNAHGISLRHRDVLNRIMEMGIQVEFSGRIPS